MGVAKRRYYGVSGFAERIPLSTPEESYPVASNPSSGETLARLVLTNIFERRRLLPRDAAAPIRKRKPPVLFTPLTTV